MATKKRTIDDIRFEIDQLRKDKMIASMESCAVTLIAVFGYFVTNMFGGYFAMKIGEQKTVNTIMGINLALALLAVGFILFMWRGNTKRMKQIKELEKEL